MPMMTNAIVTFFFTTITSTHKFKFVAYIILHQQKNGRFFPEFLLKPCKAYFHKIHFTFSYITLPTEHSPNPQRSANLFSLFSYIKLFSLIYNPKKQRLNFAFLS